MARRRPPPSAPKTTMTSLTSFTALAATSLLLLVISFLQAQGAAGVGGEQSFVPVRKVVYRSMTPAAASAAMTEAAAAPYEPFEVCEECRCCTAAAVAAASNGSSCVDTSCCYSIDCDLPGKPFGTCAFTPQSCGCGAANNCTQPSS